MYYENHHITPRHALKHKDRSFIDRPDNIVRLPHHEHIKAHKWLYLLLQDQSSRCAYNGMKYGTMKHDSTGITGRKDSKKVRIKKSKVRMGMKFTKEHCNNISKSKTGIKSPVAKLWFIHGALFYSAYEAGDFYGVSAQTIKRWCDPKSKYHLPLCYSYTRG